MKRFITSFSRHSFGVKNRSPWGSMLAHTLHQFHEQDLFNSAAAPTGADPVVVLSHGIWMERFGGDPNAVGRTITLERQPFRIIGVMPEQFAMPAGDVRLWIPWSISTASPRLSSCRRAASCEW